MDEASTRVAHSKTVLSKEIIINDSFAYLFTKRLLDIVASCLGLIFLSPLFLLLTILIKLENPKGTVLFKQTRVGKNEKEFKMYKFRSMVSNAEELLESLLDQNEVSGAMFKMKEDPRITKIGKIIRKTSIDELPQLVNVLKGEMSLVGPRPPLKREVEIYTEYQKLRLLVIPGCTGIWQVSSRNHVGFEAMLEMDMEYMRKRCLVLDMKLIYLTIMVMLRSKAF
ncbi:sugar transferase [Alkalicoccobacillus murimartini]|uniref:Lipopolysaccharide/colanic/teichoic acid biosynthesis glycosyltransferase n=1 Tax=Alkalicoccobacillus murimartini TaxID=171685 RepID=A0ABT9YGL1_9BACI|nr:sugar transferase [Alkalicoccobacillus murimartini]MDQ0206995.1 lipopolysaccharide/colanic/teichoic acid biosynthesis glycosyltransferase [Alkalicoccobacillus murimartini]